MVRFFRRVTSDLGRNAFSAEFRSPLPSIVASCGVQATTEEEGLLAEETRGILNFKAALIFLRNKIGMLSQP